MILVTGAAGFIGSALVWGLNNNSQERILILDDVGSEDKWRNLRNRNFIDIIPISELTNLLTAPGEKLKAIFHLGACSSTTEANMDFLMRHNVHDSMQLFEYAAKQRIPFIYASSAATYGNGALGYTDDHSTALKLRPLNKYGYSKFLFDRWVLNQEKVPPFWAGLKFFNVYGANEYHKGAQASVVFHAFDQVRKTSNLKLFKSYRQDFQHGEQKRDFVYIKDVVDVLVHLYSEAAKIPSGIYNVGSGKARTFKDLGTQVFKSLGQDRPSFEWIDMPENVKNQYQYFTEAPMTKLREQAKYTKPFMSLELGIDDYIRNHLLQEDPYL